jgi:hypothetical protein
VTLLVKLKRLAATSPFAIAAGAVAFTSLSLRSGGGFGGLVPGYSAAVDDDIARQALVRAYIACRLAAEALPDLPEDVRSKVSEPVTAFCDAIGPALDELDPGLLDRSTRE